MFKRSMRSMVLLLLVLALSSGLTACGDSNSTIPTYSGATSITSPDSTSSIQDVFKKANKDAKITSYTTSDGPDKVKSFFSDNFKKAGWDDKSTDSDIASTNKNFGDTMPGASVQAFTKGNHKAIILLFPGSSAPALGYQNVATSGTAYMLIDANT